MKAGKVRSRTGIIFIDTIKQEPAQRFGSANKPFLPHTISAGCVGYTVHPILIRAYFFTHNTEPIPSHVYIFTWLCTCVLLHLFDSCSSHMLLSWGAHVFHRSVQQPRNIVEGKRRRTLNRTECVIKKHRDVLLHICTCFSHPREAAGAPIPVPTVHHRALTPHPLFIHALVPLRLSKIFMR